MAFKIEETTKMFTSGGNWTPSTQSFSSKNTSVG